MWMNVFSAMYCQEHASQQYFNGKCIAPSFCWTAHVFLYKLLDLSPYSCHTSYQSAALFWLLESLMNHKPRSRISSRHVLYMYIYFMVFSVYSMSTCTWCAAPNLFLLKQNDHCHNFMIPRVHVYNVGDKFWNIVGYCLFNPKEIYQKKTCENIFTIGAHVFFIEKTQKSVYFFCYKYYAIREPFCKFDIIPVFFEGQISWDIITVFFKVKISSDIIPVFFEVKSLQT